MCEVILYLLSTLIDLGLLVVPSIKDDQAPTDKAARIEDPDILSNAPSKSILMMKSFSLTYVRMR